MSTRLRLGTHKMRMAMAPPERIECVTTSSGEKLSLDAPTLAASIWRTAIITEVLIERIFWWVSG